MFEQILIDRSERINRLKNAERRSLVIVVPSLMITVDEYHDSSQCSIPIIILASLWGVGITYVAFDLYSSYAIEFVQATTLSRSSINTK